MAGAEGADEAAVTVNVATTEACSDASVTVCSPKARVAVEKVKVTVPFASGVWMPRSIGSDRTVPRTADVNPVPVTVTESP